MNRHRSAPALQPDAIYFVSDLARVLGRTEDGIRAALRAGRLGSYGRISGRLFVRGASLIQFLRSIEVDPKRTASRGPAAPTKGGGS